MDSINNEPQNCWEFWKCPEATREKCLAYKDDLGRKCWTIPYGPACTAEKDFQKCIECFWYKKLNSSS